MKPLIQFLLITVLAYSLLIALLSTSAASGALCSSFRIVSTAFLQLTLPEAYIHSQDAFVQQKKDPNSFHIVYGNAEVIQAEHQYAKSQNIKEYKISSHSIQLFFFQLVTVPISFLMALFIATPMPWRKKGSSLSFALLILLVVILIKVYFLILYNLNASATGVYRLSESELEWVLRLISMLTLGFSVMLCFVLWLIFGFRKSNLTTVFSDYFKNMPS